MSSDLWNAFVDGSQGLSDNPWAQPSHESCEVESRQHTKPPANVFLNHEAFQRLETNGVQAAWNDSHYSGKSLLEKVEGNATDAESNNVWSNEQSSGQYLRSTLNDFQRTATDSINNPLDSFEADEDDFGDFEVPDTISSPTKVNLGTPLSTPATVAKGQSTNDETLIPNVIHKFKSNGGQPNGPYRRAASLEKRIVRVPNVRTTPIKETKKPLPEVRTQVINLEQPTTGLSYESEEWGEFSPEPGQSPSPQEERAVPTKVKKERIPPTIPHSHSYSQSSSRDLIDPSPPQPISPPNTLPPSNIPPPSFLILRLSVLIETLPTQLESAMQRFRSEETSLGALDKALRFYISSIRVAARIIAGRKLRWKRDTCLSQSMSIGPAQSTKKGMKLTSVDKAESAREDREVVEFVRVWRRQLGNIRGALAAVNQQISGSSLTLPEVTEAMNVMTVKSTEGAAVDLKGCVLCGLKRNERVVRVDVDVWDSFGEWWVELWGHVECRRLWVEHQEILSI